MRTQHIQADTVQLARFRGDMSPDGRDALARLAQLHHPRTGVVHVQVAHGLKGGQAEAAQCSPDAGALHRAGVAGMRRQDGCQGFALVV